MTGPARRTFPFRMGVALAAALMLSALPTAASDNNATDAIETTSDEPPTVAECEHQYASSAADDTCRNETITAEDGMCRIQAECLAPVTAGSGETYYDNDFLGGLYEVVRLSNCGGTLTAGSC